MADYIEKGFWVVLPYHLVKDLPNLRLSPIGVVPQRNRRPRPIVDYTFFGVNTATQPNVPYESMQFGRMLERMLRRVLLADPTKGKTYLIKVDLADGFYRQFLAPADIPKLGVTFPSAPGEPPLVALPLRLPMGWKNSPPAFCTATETIADITNQLLLQNHHALPHRLDHLADSKPPKRPAPPTPPAVAPTPSQVDQHGNIAVPIPQQADPYLNHYNRRRLQVVDIYMDDFVGASQGNRQCRQNVRRTLLHVIDDIYRPLSPTDPPTRKEPISVKKLQQGDASWSTQKEVLGWLLDTEKMTLQLTPRRIERLRELLYDEYPRSKKRTSITEWHKTLGELRSMTLALPGAKGLFSLLQDTLRNATPTSRVALTRRIHDILDDFRELHHSLSFRPTRIQELVALPPTVHGCHDAASPGAGGIVLPTASAAPRATKVKISPTARTRQQRNAAPIVWRFPFPKSVQRALVTFDNPKGTITNTDLELVGSILQTDAAVQNFDLRERTQLHRTDNLGTLFWQRKGSTTTTKAAAGLLRVQALHQRYHRSINLYDYLPGPLNEAADDASRLQHLTNSQFLAHFNAKYPQKQSWRLWMPPRQLSSNLISVLLNTPSPSASPLVAPAPPIPIGTSGVTSAPNWPSILSSKTLPTPSSSYKYSSIDIEQAALHPSISPSSRAPLRMPYVALAKRSLQWAKPIPATLKKGKWISVLPDKSVTTRNRIRLPIELSQSLSPSYSTSWPPQL
jgi:hypothetical protein